ncbi:hypothetical protein Pyn_40920 [Prunus yedoensis var. nudiflora]|uniref:Uncharacterized protein n=1 Tax=Prunus yedoensis var. nudiflora TaxID=2094558 RepID=A0A314UUN2_PRUYE|nr:hypothetical protein Pyn_40920 [Prunus yedoensis var. nudiflora]
MEVCRPRQSPVGEGKKRSNPKFTISFCRENSAIFRAFRLAVDVRLKGGSLVGFKYQLEFQYLQVVVWSEVYAKRRFAF